MQETALTTCWYTRMHQPDLPPRPAQMRAAEVFEANCRYCRRRIFSLDGKHWHLDGGFNIDKLLKDTNAAYFTVEDTVEGMVVARFPIPLEASKIEVLALRAQIIEQYDLHGEGGSHLILHETRSAPPPRRGRKKPATPRSPAL